MKDVKKSLTGQEKANLIASADKALCESVQSMRKKLIQEGFLTSYTQVQVLDKLLWGVRDAESGTLSKALLENLVKTKQVTLIQNIVELFREGWKLSRAFKFYTGSGPVAEMNAWKIRRILEVIAKKDRSDFPKMEADEVKKSVVPKKKPVNKSAKPALKKEKTVVPVTIKTQPVKK